MDVSGSGAGLAGKLPPVEARSYFLMDFYSGVVLAAKDEETPYPPASMTKMMTALVVLDDIQDGKLHWDDVVTVSKRAADVEEAQIYLTEGEKITVKELFEAMLIYSANDATVHWRNMWAEKRRRICRPDE